MPLVTPEEMVAHMLGSPARAAAAAIERAKESENLAKHIIDLNHGRNPNMTSAHREALQNTLADNLRAILSTPIPECTAFGWCKAQTVRESVPPEKLEAFKKAQLENLRNPLEAHHKEYYAKANKLMSAAVEELVLKGSLAIWGNHSAVQLHRAVKEDIAAFKKNLHDLQEKYNTIHDVKLHGVNL